MKRQLAFLLLGLFIMAMTSCKVTFVPGHDPTAVNMITKIKDESTNMFAQIAQSTDRSYDNFSSTYAMVNADIDSLVAYDQRRKKSGIIVKQDQEMKTEWMELLSEHQASIKISASQAVNNSNYFRSTVDPRLISENGM